jgi:pheromone shutdown-related protein TraB
MTDNITEVKLSDRKIIILGTAHVSKDSVREVEETIRSESPDRVCVEIDDSRYKALIEGKSWSQLNIYQIIREKKVFLLLGNLVLSSFQKRMGLELGVKPGSEMLRAVEIAKEDNIPFSLCDRELQITLRRAWAKASFWGKNKLLAALFGSIFTKEKLTEEEIEVLKRKSELESMMEELAGFLPTVKEVLIDERDRYLATKIYTSAGKTIVAVVGAGHVPGMVKILNKLDRGETTGDLQDISVVPPRKKILKILPYLIPAAIIFLVVLGFFRSGWEGGLEMLKRWVLVNGSLSALGSIIALAHPLTIIVAFLAAPITSLNPTIGVGLVTGLLEAFFRKPRVSDFETLSDDIMSFKGFYKNRFTHILLVFMFSSIGSSIGTFIAMPFLFPGTV